MWHTRVFLCLALAFLAGCGTMLPGTIASGDGRILPFQIEKAYRSGAVAAYDPASGERFSGSYVGIIDGTTSVAYSQHVGWGFASATSNIANATAYLSGDKGTTLECQMQIERGIYPHGIGQCTDNRAENYHLQF